MCKCHGGAWKGSNHASMPGAVAISFLGTLALLLQNDSYLDDESFSVDFLFIPPAHTSRDLPARLSKRGNHVLCHVVAGRPAGSREPPAWPPRRCGACRASCRVSRGSTASSLLQGSAWERPRRLTGRGGSPGTPRAAWTWQLPPPSVNRCPPCTICRQYLRVLPLLNLFISENVLDFPIVFPCFFFSLSASRSVGDA